MPDMEGQSTLFWVDGELQDAWGNAHDPEELDNEGDGGSKYAGMTARALVAEIKQRNEGREEADQITLDGKKKADAIAALEADDEEHEDDDSSEE